MALRSHNLNKMLEVRMLQWFRCIVSEGDMNAKI